MALRIRCRSLDLVNQFSEKVEPDRRLDLWLSEPLRFAERVGARLYNICWVLSSATVTLFINHLPETLEMYPVARLDGHDSAAHFPSIERSHSSLVAA